MTSKRTALARSLRQDSGLAERRVWTLLRNGQIDGYKFRRQHPVDRYVADFACDRLRLVIEIDGGIHDWDEVVISDHCGRPIWKPWAGLSYASATPTF